VGIELPNHSAEFVTLKQMLTADSLKKTKSKLSVALGLDVSGRPLAADIARMPHVLIAGATGSGKTVCLNSFICTVLFRASPNEVKFILVDPKRVELIQYNGIPHLLTPVIVEPEKVVSALKWAIGEMDRRYKLFAETGVRNIDAYNELSGFTALPYIIIIVDELADIMLFAPVEVEDTICRIAQMARATGIHLIISTQRPSVDVLTGLIKANIPCRISFAVSSMVDSRVIIDQGGAEKLLGRGDMLYIPPDQAKPTRIQGALVSEPEIQKVIAYLRKEAAPAYTEEVTTMPVRTFRGGLVGTTEEKDELFDEALRTVCQYDRASASLLQRRLSIGYARAARILDQLEAAGVVGPAEGSKPRDVLIRSPEEASGTRAEA
jgi:S-DNA-T family DNA segregation ATPase FtsK/SpoIIIE